MSLTVWHHKATSLSSIRRLQSQNGQQVVHEDTKESVLQRWVPKLKYIGYVVAVLVIWAVGQALLYWCIKQASERIKIVQDDAEDQRESPETNSHWSVYCCKKSILMPTIWSITSYNITYNVKTTAPYFCLLKCRLLYFVFSFGLETGNEKWILISRK